MDNIFEILIYLFIIFSIFSPLFKKKEKKPPVPPMRQNDEEHIPVIKQSTKTEQEEYDILKEIEGLFKTETTAPVKTEVPDKRTAIEQKADEEKKKTTLEIDADRRAKLKIPAKGEFTSAPTYSEHVYTDWNKKVKVDDAVARKAALFSEMLKRKKEVVRNENIQRIYTNIKNPVTLKDYIIFSEIIGKPKALKR